MKRRRPILNLDYGREMLRGRRQIMEFLGVRSWRTVRRYRDVYHLPILCMPSGRPVALRSMLIQYIVELNKLLEEENNKGADEKE